MPAWGLVVVCAVVVFAFIALFKAQFLKIGLTGFTYTAKEPAPPPAKSARSNKRSPPKPSKRTASPAAKIKGKP